MSAPPNQVLLNEYDVDAAAGGGSGSGGGGGIAPHNDGALFEPAVAILTLGSSAVLHFWPRSSPTAAAAAGPGAADGGVVATAAATRPQSGWQAVDGLEPVCSVLLQPRSLLVRPCL